MTPSERRERAWDHAETASATAVACGRYLALDLVSARQSDSDILRSRKNWHGECK